MADPLVTVLMAVHNGGSYLKGAVEGVLAQEFKDFELLIIDDCSSDASIEAAVGISPDARVRVHRNAVNLGQTASLNLGLSLARGALVARMDADDIAYPSWLTHQVALMERYPDCAVAGCDAVVMDEGGRIYKKLCSPLSRPQMILKSLFASPLNHVGCLMRREVVLAHGGYDPSLRIAADFDLWSKLLRAGLDLRAQGLVGVAVRAHQASVTAVNKGEADVPEICRIIDGNIKFFSNASVSPAQLKQWWLLAYVPERLSADELMGMDELMGLIYGKLRLERVGCSIREARHFFNLQRKLFLFKWFLGFCTRPLHSAPYRAFFYLLRKRGLCSFYGLLWVLTLGGLACGPCMLMYNHLRKMQVLSKKVV